MNKGALTDLTKESLLRSNQRKSGPILCTTRVTILHNTSHEIPTSLQYLGSISAVLAGSFPETAAGNRAYTISCSAVCLHSQNMSDTNGNK